MKEQEKLKSTVLKLYSAGSKVADIVTQTDVPRSTVYYWIKNGLPKKWSEQLDSYIWRYYYLQHEFEKFSKFGIRQI